MEGMKMQLSYKKLFKKLIDLDLKKKDLCDIAKISTSSVTKLANNQHVNTEILEKICNALNCNIEDIAEMEITRTDLVGDSDER